MNSVNTEYKDSLIRKIFSSPDKALELYNAVTGKNLSCDTVVEIKDLEPVLLSRLRNDLSFIIDGRLVVFLEHQSTVNKNMPLRMLQYLLVFYETHCEIGKALYKEKRINLPKPEFYVLYNGTKNQPEKQMWLSDAFIGMEYGETPQLELVVNIININYGENPDIMEKSENLKGYAIFVSKVREYEKDGKNTNEAVSLAY
ncbi:MAG: Rpn family recombination-promoting nuclease/putative transposase, partial [Clostridiales bacterium]|nr:Rpn family recombination-promoting nuclease/putative transposase [Clostridiales bacterium]